MRLKWLSSFIVLLVLFAGTSFGFEDEASHRQPSLDSEASVGAPDEATIETARGKDKVRVLAPNNYPPFAFVDDQGLLGGIAVDLLALAAKRLDLDLEFVEAELDTFPEMMEHREADISLLVADPPGPGSSVITTQPFMESREAIITQQDKVGIHGLKDLRASTVTAMQGGPAMANLTAAYPDVKILPRESVLDALRDVASGLADAYVGPLGTATYYIQKHLLTGLKVAGLAQDRVIRFKMGVRSDKPQLHAMLQQALDRVDDGQRQALVNRYFSSDSVSGIELAFSLTPDERGWLDAHPEMRLGVTGSRPPIESFGPNGRYEGISSEYVQIISELLGTKMVPVRELSWTQTLQAARERKIDVIALVAKSPERAAFLLFTKPYLISQGVIVTRRDAPPLSGLKDLEGKRVAVVTGEMAEEQIALNYPAIDLVRVNTVEEGLGAVADGKAAGFVESMTMVSTVLSSPRFDSLKVAAATGFAYEYCMGVRRDWPELVSFLDEALATVKDQRRNAIHDHWVNVPIDHRTDRNLIWSVLALAAAFGGSILVVILVGKRRLAREVAVRKLAEEKIGEQAALLSGLLDSIPDMVFFKSISGIYLGCNPAFSRFVGRPGEEITGRTDYDLFEKEVADLFRDNDRVIIKSGEPQHREEWVVYPDGNRVFLALSKAPLRDGAGHVKGVLGIGRNITERKPADELKVEHTVAVEAAEPEE